MIFSDDDGGGGSNTNVVYTIFIALCPSYDIAGFFVFAHLLLLFKVICFLSINVCACTCVANVHVPV